MSRPAAVRAVSILAYVAAGLHLILPTFSLASLALTSNSASFIAVVMLYTLFTSVASAALLVTAAVGLSRGRSWAWPLLAGVAGYATVVQVKQILLAVANGMPLAASIPLFFGGVFGAAFYMALVPSVRRACSPPPAAW